MVSYKNPKQLALENNQFPWTYFETNPIYVTNSTYADLAFIPWNNMFGFIFGDEVKTVVPEDKYPNFWAWHNRLLARPGVKTALAAQAKALGH